jgi:hypothetical protein
LEDARDEDRELNNQIQTDLIRQSLACVKEIERDPPLLEMEAAQSVKNVFVEPDEETLQT